MSVLLAKKEEQGGSLALRGLVNPQRVRVEGFLSITDQPLLGSVFFSASPLSLLSAGLGGSR